MGTHVNPRTISAKVLRETENPAEQALWAVLKARGLGGYKFERQMPIGPYYADFVCRTCGVVIEVGELQTPEAHERARDEYMLAAGYSVFRVPAAAVIHDLENVKASILAVLEDRLESFLEAQQFGALN